MSSIRCLTRRCLAALVVALPTWALAQAWPTKPITIIVPYPPGGTTDVLARVLQEPLQAALGQSVVIDNKPGASAMLGTKLAARAPADGYTLVMPNNALVISPHISKDATWSLKDFAPISITSLQPMTFLVHPSVPAQNLQQFIDYAKANPGKIEYATAGPASFGHLATELFARRAGLKMVHIPYKGQAPTTQALLSGEVKMVLSTSSAQTNAFIKEGKVRILGVASQQPTPLAPGGVPMSQTLPGFEAEVWFGLLAPAGTPKDVITKLNEALAKVLALPDVKARYEAAGAAAVSTTPEQFAARLAEESTNWAGIVKEANIKGE